MSAIKSIREHLGLTQAAFAEGIGCTQGNVGHYERGQTVPPEAAARVIAFAATRGLAISFDHIYGAAELAPAEQAPGRTPSTPAAQAEG